MPEYTARKSGPQPLAPGGVPSSSLGSTCSTALRALLILGCIAAPIAASAECPDGDPCERIAVYRTQSWPVNRFDAKEVDQLTLREANGADSAAFPAIVKAYTARETDLAIRFDVVMDRSLPHDYRECVFQDEHGKGCRGRSDTKDCFRQCGTNSDVTGGLVRYSGFQEKASGGEWLSFPAISDCSRAGRVWRKNPIAPKETDCDWEAERAVIKSAKCIKDALESGSDLERLFEEDTPCPIVPAESLAMADGQAHAREVSAGSSSATTGSGFGAARGVIGKGVMVGSPDTNLIESIADGRTLFADLGGCLERDPDFGPALDSEDKFFERTDQFYSYLRSRTKIDPKLEGKNTMSASLDVLYTAASSQSYKVRGFVVERFNHIAKFYVSERCKETVPMADGLLEDFQALPVQVSNPSTRKGWADYAAFVRRYGSHYIAAAITGASFRQFTFSRDEESFTKEALTAKVCTDIEGSTSAGKVTVKACQDVSTKDREKHKNLETTSRRVVRGCSVEIGSKLQNMATPADEIPGLIEKCMVEANQEARDAVVYHLKPVWELLELRLRDMDSRNRVANLEAYVSDFFAADCALRTDGDDPEGVVLRELVQTEKDPNEYLCRQPAQGCQVEATDCHARWGCIGFCCSCWGDSCIARDADDMSVVRHTDTGSYTDEPSNSCTWSWGCSCDERGKKWEPVPR